VIMMVVVIMREEEDEKMEVFDLVSVQGLIFLID
jgi:hypothetical protein